MDRSSKIGFGIIVILITAWMFYNSMQQQLPVPAAATQSKDSSKTKVDSSLSKAANQIPQSQLNNILPENDSSVAVARYGSLFAAFVEGTEKVYTIKTDLAKITFTNKGAALTGWELNKFQKWDKEPSQLINYGDKQLTLNFLSTEAKAIDTKNLFYKINTDQTDFVLHGTDSLVLRASIDISPGKSIVKTFTFYGDKYHFEQNISLENLENVLLPSTNCVFYNWDGGMHYQEQNSVDESNEAVGFTQTRDKTFELDANEDLAKRDTARGTILHVYTKIKYFAAAIIPAPADKLNGTVLMTGTREHTEHEGMIEKYNLAIQIPYHGGKQSNSFKVYIGPLDYDIIKSYGIEDALNFGWKWLVRPIGEYFMLPVFNAIHYVVPNWGLVIIIFSIFIKLVLYPLSITQLKSSQKMQLLAPEIAKIREKYGEDQMKQQQETMALYREYGINPAGGCLPLLLQMPILYSMWAVLGHAIVLRHTEFIWWIKDLATPDVIFRLPMKLIFFDTFSGLALLMGITMFIQQKMTISDPRQKAMVYMMPVMFTVMFASFPSGLNLYYFMFNLLSIAQQYYMNKISKKRLTLEQMRRSPKKEGWFAKKMREAQDLAQSQGRTLPGQSKKYNRNQRKK
ncbi:MAG: membrane protein insertase YidC [Candidatus Kapabacteria bacterium]|nr:membrane protein insertase YidC [Candidatus Kapabacteria bacterium]